MLMCAPCRFVRKRGGGVGYTVCVSVASLGLCSVIQLLSIPSIVAQHERVFVRAGVNMDSM
jgi:hypothetical protein